MPTQTLKQLITQLQLPSPVTEIQNPLLAETNIQLFIKRDELIHPVIQGNKWRKLKYNLLHAEQNKPHTLLSFGGAYSNHLHALAAIGKVSGFKTIGIIRGEAPKQLNPCLQDMLNWGMQLDFISRKSYRNKNDALFTQQLHQQYGEFHLIPEGGNNQAGIQGCAEILHELKDHYDFICCEVGSGTMLTSLILHNNSPRTQFLGFAVMKNPQLDQEIRNNLNGYIPQDHILEDPASDTPSGTHWQINHHYHFGGFAKTSAELNTFIHTFKQQHHIQLEPVYSGKMLYGILDMIKQGHFRPNTRILAIHGGGLQGLRGFSVDFPGLFSPSDNFDL